MGYSNALPNKTSYSPDFVKASFNSLSTSGYDPMGGFNLAFTNSSYIFLNPCLIKVCTSASVMYGLCCTGCSPCKEASSLIEISAWSDLPLALAMASSFARRSGSSRIEYGGGRLSVFILQSSNGSTKYSSNRLEYIVLPFLVCYVWYYNELHRSTDIMEQKRQAPRSIRLDPEIEAWVKHQAKAGDRSLNAEINRVLRKAKEATEQKQTA